MLNLEIVRANADINIGRYSFTDGHLYWSRLSKSGDKFIVEDDRGEWCVVADFSCAKAHIMLVEFRENFKRMKVYHPKNYRECKEMTDGFPY